MIRRRRANLNREQVVKTASDITENLLSVTRMMDNTVGQSAQSLESLGNNKICFHSFFKWHCTFWILIRRNVDRK